MPLINETLNSERRKYMNLIIFSFYEFDNFFHFYNWHMFMSSCIILNKDPIHNKVRIINQWRTYKFHSLKNNMIYLCILVLIVLNCLWRFLIVVVLKKCNPMGRISPYPVQHLVAHIYYTSPLLQANHINTPLASVHLSTLSLSTNFTHPITDLEP